MKLVINGDDLGYTMGNTYGILEAYHKGILRSTTALANSKYLERAAELCKDCPDLGVGVHLTLTLGVPLTENKTLHDSNGSFYAGRSAIWSKNPDYDEIYTEWKAQIERFIKVFGRMPSHLDSHHAVHDATPEALRVSQKLAGEYGLEMRRYSRFKYVSGFYGPTATRENMIQILKDHEHDDIEVMVHPGWCDLELYRSSSYSQNRVVELDVLCSDEVMQYINDHHIQLVHY